MCGVVLLFICDKRTMQMLFKFVIKCTRISTFRLPDLIYRLSTKCNNYTNGIMKVVLKKITLSGRESVKITYTQ